MPRLKFKQLNQNVTSTQNQANLSGSMRVTGSLFLTQDIVVGGTLTAQEFRTELINASVIYQSGSTKFGDSPDDTHSYTGSVVVTGSFFLNNLDVRETITTSNVFKITGSHASTNYDIKITGSNDIEISTTDQFSISADGAEKFKVTSEGITFDRIDLGSF